MYYLSNSFKHLPAKIEKLAGCSKMNCMREGRFDFYPIKSKSLFPYDITSPVKGCIHDGMIKMEPAVDYYDHVQGILNNLQGFVTGILTVMLCLLLYFVTYPEYNEQE